LFTQQLIKVSGVLFASLAMSVIASAQYGGGGMGSTGAPGNGATGNMGGYGSGSGKAIGIGVGAAAGAAVGIALLVRHHHHSAAAEQAQASMTGCTQSVLNGISFKNESDNQTYILLSKGTALQAGERVELKGVVTGPNAGPQALRVQSLVKDYGACGTASADAGKSTGEMNEIAQLPAK
jgi:hypothetical protein